MTTKGEKSSLTSSCSITPRHEDAKGAMSRARVRGTIVGMSASPKLKDPCYGSFLSDADQKLAEEAQLASRLDLLEVHCVACGQLVVARKRNEGGFEPDPRPHERFTVKRQTPSKPGPRKTF